MKKIDKEFREKAIYIEELLSNCFEWDVSAPDSNNNEVVYKIYHVRLDVCDDSYLDNIDIAWTYQNNFSILLNDTKSAFQFKEKELLITFIEVFSEASIDFVIHNVTYQDSPYRYTASYEKDGLKNIEEVLFTLIELRYCTKQYLEQLKK